ncbi:MAG: hypothetical protein NVS9B4_20320 [Candidatus Acidiferrum sp.]
MVRGGGIDIATPSECRRASHNENESGGVTSAVKMGIGQIKIDDTKKIGQMEIRGIGIGKIPIATIRDGGTVTSRVSRVGKAIHATMDGAAGEMMGDTGMGGTLRPRRRVILGLLSAVLMEMEIAPRGKGTPRATGIPIAGIAQRRKSA